MSLIRRRSPVAADGDRTRPGAGRRTGPLAPRTRRLARGALLVAAGTAALSLAGPFALRPFADVAGAAGQVTVAFVLDFGTSPANQVAGCVTVPDSDTRYDALSAFVAQSRLAPPTYAASGLLCSIDGVPSSGCGQVVDGAYIYWSYFTGADGGWTYASSGAFGTVTPNDVEGWRFQDPGTGRPNDPPPRTAPSYATLCGSGTAAASGHTGKGGGKAAGGGAAARAGAGAAAARVHRQRVRTGPTGGSSARDSRSTATSAPPTTTSTYPPDPATTTLPDTSIPPDPEVGVATIAHHVTSGAGPDPLIVGGLLVAALAIAAFVRWRRRPRLP